MARPRFSVVMPTYQRADVLAGVLDAWEQQEPRDLQFELLVVDDGSSDGTPELLRARQPERFHLRSFRQANSGPAAARNRALGAADGELLLFTGDDIEPAPDLLARHAKAHASFDDPAAAVLGLTRWPIGCELTATMAHIDGPGAQQFSYHYMVDGAEYDFRHFYTSNVSARKRLLELEPSRFSTDFPAAAFEDAEYAYRLARRGLRIVYRADAVAYHHHHYSARSFFDRQVRCGAMAHVLWSKHPELARWLPIGEVELRRCRIAELGLPASRMLDAIATVLPAWERRAIDLACFFDPLPSAPVGTLLEPLFRYAYWRGTATAHFEPRTADRVAAALLVELIPGAVESLSRHLDALRLPCPGADVTALTKLGTGVLGELHP